MSENDELIQSARLIMELIREQKGQVLDGKVLKPDNHKLSEAGLLLSKVLRANPPNATVPLVGQGVADITADSLLSPETPERVDQMEIDSAN